jgi:hypothetical protein
MLKMDDKIQNFVRQMIEEWQPNPFIHVLNAGVEGLTVEFANKEELSSICTWLAKPDDEYLIGVVQGIIDIENPELGTVANIITEALIDACVQRHLVNKAVATDNIALGTLGGIGLLFVIVALFKKEKA